MKSKIFKINFKVFFAVLAMLCVTNRVYADYVSAGSPKILSREFSNNEIAAGCFHYECNWNCDGQEIFNIQTANITTESSALYIRKTSSGWGYVRMGFRTGNPDLTPPTRPRTDYTYCVFRMKGAVGGENLNDIAVLHGHSNTVAFVGGILHANSPSAMTTAYQDFYMINASIPVTNDYYDLEIQIHSPMTIYIDQIFYTDVPPHSGTTVTLSNETCNSIKVSWTEVTDAVSYEVYRCTSANLNSCLELVHTENSYTGEFVDTLLAAGTTYYYMVKAIGISCSYQPSVVQSTTTIGSLQSPTIVVEERGTTSFLLLFTLPEGAESYTLYRSTAVAGGFAEVMEYTGGERFVDNGLDPNTTYHYKLVANFDDGCLSYTIKSAKTPENFGITGALLGSDCSTLVGFTNFAYYNNTDTVRWKISQIKFGGVATQQITMTTTTVGNREGYVAGGDFNPGYAVVPNPRLINTNCFDTTRINGGWCVIRSNLNPSLTYKISGLNSSTTVPAELRKYCVRVKMRVLGNNVNGAAGVAPNSTPRGTDFRVDIQDFDGTVRPVENGRYMVTNPWYNDNYNNTWNGNQNLNGLTYTGSCAVVEGTVMVMQEDGFQIRIRTTHENLHIAIESIEVYGCVPKVINITDRYGNIIARNSNNVDICEKEQITISAVSGFVEGDEEIIWKKDGIYFSTGNVVSVTAPVKNTTVTYTATGSLGSYSITLHGKFCCNAVGGELVTVFAEHFNMPSYDSGACDDNACVCLPGGGDWTCLPTSVGGSISSKYRCATRPNDGYYAIVKNTSCWYDWGNMPEHTCYAGGVYADASEYLNTVYLAPGTPSVPAGPACNANSGMLLVNAADMSANDFFYRHTLTGLCDNTNYEFSAWYASISPAEAKPNITFAVYMEDEDGSVPLDRSPIESFNTGTIRDFRVWHNVKLNFTTPTGTGRYRLMVQNNCANDSAGNDLVIDDIVVKKCVTRLQTIDTLTGNTLADVCTFNPSSVTLGFDTTYSIQQLIGNGGDVWVQWAYSTSPDGPWTPIGNALIDASALNDTIRTIVPIGNGETYYYIAKISANRERAADLSGSVAATCGNDVFSAVFTLRRLVAVRINITPDVDTLRVCESNPIEIIAVTSEATQWGWRRGSIDGVFITNGGAISSDEVHKTYYKASAQLSDEGTYYFYVKKGDCESKDSIYIKVIDENFVYRDTLCDNQFPYSGFGFVDLQPRPENNYTYTRPLNECVVTLFLTVNQTYSFEFDTIVSDRNLPYLWAGHGIICNNAGIYYDSLQTNTTTRCDSVYKLDLKIKTTIRITETDTICQPDSYEFYGKIFTTTTFIVDSLVSSAERENDTIFNLSLWVGQPYLREYNAQICRGAPYIDDNFNIPVPTDDIYERHLYTSLGCDSIIRLNLTVNEPIETNIYASICEGERYTENNFDENEDGTHIQRKTTSNGCDSIIYLHLTVNELIKINIYDTVCGTAPYKENGFNITVPETKTYYNTLATALGCDSVIALNLMVKLSIIVQKWDDVIAVLNKEFGLYDFDILSFQWYKNDFPIPGENGSYLYVAPDVLDTTALYYVEITTTDGDVILSCKLQPKIYDCLTCPQVLDFTQYPPQIKTNRAGVANMYNVQGILVGSQNFEAGTTELLIAAPKGMYILQIVLKDGYSKAFKMIKN